MNKKRTGLISVLTYTLISLAVAGIFLGVTWRGDYSWVARAGGAVWVFLLSMIITMPLITSYYKKKYQS
jgi:hypothetical protein